jgi:transposase
LITAPLIAVSSNVQSFIHPVRPAGIIVSYRGAVRGKLFPRVPRIWLTRTRHDWLRTSANNGYSDKASFLALTKQNLKTARAWRIKEAANGLWSSAHRDDVERNWKSLLSWISRCRLEPMIKLGRTIKTHMLGDH